MFASQLRTEERAREDINIHPRERVVEALGASHVARGGEERVEGSACA